MERKCEGAKPAERHFLNEEEKIFPRVEKINLFNPPNVTFVVLSASEESHLLNTSQRSFTAFKMTN